MFPRITKTVRSLHSPLLQTKGLAPRFNIGLRTFSNSSHTSKGSGRPPLKDPDAQMLKDLDSLTGNGTTSKRFGTANRLREFDMDEKVVVITGGVGGLGMHMAEALLEAGAHGKSFEHHSLLNSEINPTRKSHQFMPLIASPSPSSPKNFTPSNPVVSKNSTAGPSTIVRWM